MTYDEFKQNFLPEFLNINSFAGRMRYAKENLQGIGSGTGRIVFDIDGEKVLKLAKNQKGIAQNEAEAGAGYYDDTQHIVAKIFNGADDDTWLIAEKAKKVNEKRIKELTGIPSLSELYEFLRNYEAQSKGQKEYFNQKKDISEFFWENEFAQDLQNFIADYSQNAGDMGRPSSYGEVLRDGQPAIVLTDYGLNDEVYDTYYNPQRKNKYQMYELFNYADGNDDILSDTGDQSVIRRGMWAQMPYSVNDGQGVINEEFNNFVSNRDSYPDKSISGLPVLSDHFHDCVNNIKEVLNHVDNKQRFYENLLKLQEYMIRRGFYNRDPLLSEEYIINEDTPSVEWGSLNDNGYSDELVSSVAKKLGLTAPRYLGGGANGFAYEINDNLVMKITADVSEADAASKLMRGKPEHIATIFNLYKVVDNTTNQAFFVIMQENINNKPIEKFRKFDLNLEAIMPAGLDYGAILKAIKIPKRFNYNEMIEVAKHLLTDSPEANVSESERQETYKYLVGLLDIRRELIEFGIKSTDYIEIANLGYKNGVLKFFDTGGYRGVEPDIADSNIIQLPENYVAGDKFDREIADKIALKVGQDKGLGTPTYYDEGDHGYAYNIGDKIMKVTSDKTELTESLKIIGKNLKHLANIYGVFEIEPREGSDAPVSYVMIGEKLNTDKPYFDKMVQKLDYVFEKILGLDFIAVIDDYANNDYYDKKEKINNYLSKNPEDANFFNGLLAIADEANQNGIESMEYLNTGNLGYKPSGELAFFDMGLGDIVDNPNNSAEKIEVDEDGSSLFSTDDAMGQDGFPTYNQGADSSPSINNSLDANIAMYEDLEYNHVKGDATQDEYEISEDRKKSWVAGSKAVTVKKKCQLGGNGDGTSTACNQGDINNLEFSNLNENDVVDEIKITPEIEEYVSDFNTDEELLKSGGIPIDMLDRAAHGIDSSLKQIPPRLLNIKWKDDLENVIYEVQKSGLSEKEWAKKINLSEPIDVSYDGKKFYIEDGHHRYYAAKILNKPLNINLEIKANPIVKLSNLGYDDFHRKIWNQVNDKSEDVENLNEVGESRAEFLSWKRKNVTLRGVKELGKDNEVWGSFGKGLYTVPLGNKSMAREYGEVYFVVNAIPKNPKVVQNLNAAEMWRQDLVENFSKKNGISYDLRFFEKNTTIEKEILGLGYDGLIIKGREMVNYSPEDIKYFRTENELESYYNHIKPESGNLNEVGEGNLEPYDISIEKSISSVKAYTFTTEDGDEYRIEFGRASLDENMWDVNFKIVDQLGEPATQFTDVVNKGRMYRVMATILKVMKGFFANTKPDVLVIEPSKSRNEYDDRRFLLYLSYIEKHLPQEYEMTKDNKEILIKKKGLDEYFSSLIPDVDEGVGDKYAEKFGVEPEFRNFEKQYGLKQYEDSIIYIENDEWGIIKNPKTLSNLGANIRGIITKTGDLYVETFSKKLHTNIVDVLMSKRIVNTRFRDALEDTIPQEYLSVQRYHDTNKMLVGESNDAMQDDEFMSVNWRKDLGVPEKEEVLPHFQRFLDAAKQKNSGIEFINEHARVYDRMMAGIRENMNEKKITKQEFAKYGDLGENVINNIFEARNLM